MALNYYMGPKTLTELFDLPVTPLAGSPVGQALPDDAGLFLLDDVDPGTAIINLQAIRQSSRPAVYLCPVVLVGENDSLPPQLLQAVDGRLSTGEKDLYGHQQLSDRIHAIQRRIEALGAAATAPDHNIGLKTLRYLHTRETELCPLSGLHSAQGYSFPAADPFLTRTDGSLFKILTFLKRQVLLKSSFVAKAHFCSQCQSAFLNFMETCPQCGSPDLHSDDLIHHFECGFVGNETEYGEGAARTCPKCRRPLRQLGVDYDKPSAVSVCNSCAHTSQDPPVSTLCYNCGAQAAPEDLLQRSIERYSLTALGGNAARFGLDNLFRTLLEKEVGALPLATFRQFLEKEIGRIKRYGKAQSALGMLAIGELEQLYLRLGDNAGDVFAELSTIIRAALRDSDIIASLNDAVFLILLVETPDAGAQQAMARLEADVVRLLDANLKESLPLTTAWRPVSGEDTVDGLIGEIVPS